MYVNVGTVNGILFRVTLDKTSGQLSDKRARFLGTKPVKLFNVKVGGQEGLLALSSRSWLCYNNQGRFTMMPISYVPLEFASGFRYIVIWSCFVTANSLPFFYRSEQCPEGVVAISNDNLRIFTTEQVGDMFNQSSIPLRYHPRFPSVLPLF